MQKTCGADARGWHSRTAGRFGDGRIPRPGFCSIALAALAAFVLAVLIMLAPQPAYAKDYTMPQVDISAEVLSDGSMEVDERRTFDFDGSFTCVWWTFDSLPAGGSLEVDGVSLIGPSGQAEAVPEVPFQTMWRDSGGPGYASYSVDDALHSVYVFFDVEDESLTVDLSYKMVGAAQAYSDVAELYWEYVGSEWAESSNDVTCTIKLPMPEGESAQAGENVRAWGHGPLNGEVAVNDDGTVSYTVSRVPSGEFAEARVAFPVEWVPDVPSAFVHPSSALDGILAEEQEWADEANAKRVGSVAFIVLFIVMALALIGWAFFMFFRHGKEYKPQFQEEYWRDVPDPQARPAEIGRLWRWEKESPNDFTATVMQLAHKGAILMEKGSYADERGRVVEDYCMIKVPEVADSVTEQNDPLGSVVLDMLFDRFPAGDSAAEKAPQQHVWFGTINKYGKKHPQQFHDAMNLFQATLSRRMDGLDYFETKGSMLKMVMATVGFLSIGAGFLGCVLLENLVPLVSGVVTGIVLLVVSHFMSRMTHHGAEVRAKAEALKRWLTDFSALDERPPTDVKVWGEFMVYAYEFGIAEQVIKELQLKVPEMFVDDTAGTAYLPWWFWYMPHHMYGAGPSLSSVLSNTMTNTLNTVNTALSSSSSGSGMGGGFSVGGGGGFGGGGGGAR